MSKNIESDKKGSNFKTVFGGGLFIIGLFFMIVYFSIGSLALKQIGVMLITGGVFIYIAGSG